MVYTLTLNPSLDYILNMDKLNIGTVNRSIGETVYPGGKGINVSIMLNRLQVENLALGFTAGFTGHELENMLKSLGCNFDFVRLKSGNTRINFKLQSGDITEINCCGPSVTDIDIKLILEKINRIQNGDVLVLSGSIPGSIPNSFHDSILEELSLKQVLTVVDTCDKMLVNTLKHRPFLIKPNQSELSEIFGVEINNISDIVFYANKLKSMGAKNVLVSMSEDGAVLVTEHNEVYFAQAPKASSTCTVGCGDSMVAGFVAKYLENKDLKESFCYSVAAGSATAFSEWLASAEKISFLEKQIICEKIITEKQ